MIKPLTAARVFTILHQLGFEIVETKVGNAILCDSHTAFIFSVVTGASYLDDDYFPFTAKGLTKTFNSHFSKVPVWGLFENGSLGFTPRNLKASRPYISSGPKYILPIEISSENSAQEVISTCRNSVTDPENYLFFRIESWKSGNGMESFLEFLACQIFRQQGFLVETQIALSATTGSPDFGAFRTPEVFSLMSKFLGQDINGLHLIELSMIGFAEKFFLPPASGNKAKGLSQAFSIVGEAKVGASDPNKQISKYRSTDLFTHSIALLDHEPKHSISPSSALYVNSSDQIIIDTSTSEVVELNDAGLLDEYLKWIELVVKIHLFVNLDSEEIIQIYSNSTSSKFINESQAVIEMSESFSTNEILDLLSDTLR